MKFYKCYPKQIRFAQGKILSQNKLKQSTIISSFQYTDFKEKIGKKNFSSQN